MISNFLQIIFCEKNIKINKHLNRWWSAGIRKHCNLTRIVAFFV